MNCLQFIWYRALAEIRADMSRGFLGFLWWIAEPILYMGAFYVVFGLVFQQRGENYVPFLLCGLITWKWFDSSIRNGAMSITHNMVLIYQVYLPKIVFPGVALVNSTLRFSFVFLMLLLFLVATGVPFSHTWLTDLPLLLLLQLALMAGLAMTASAIVPFVPDLKFLIDNGMMLLFFLSGVFFRLDTIPDTLRPYFDLNPIGVLIHEYREVLIAGQSLDWYALSPVVVISGTFLIMGTLLLKAWDRAYAKKAFL